jgi:hypothetical protein
MRKRDEIRKHQKGRESKDGERAVVAGGKNLLFERRCRGKGSFCPFFLFFFLFPLVCVTDNSSSSNLVEAREGECAGRPLGLCCRVALYVERDHSGLHGILRCLSRDPASLACDGHSALGLELYGRIGTPLPPYCVVVQGRKSH